MQDRLGSFSWLTYPISILILGFFVAKLLLPSWEIRTTNFMESKAIRTFFQEHYSPPSIGIDEPIEEWKITDVTERERSPKRLYEDGRSNIRKNHFRVRVSYLPLGETDWTKAKGFWIKEYLMLDKSDPLHVKVRILQEGE